MPSTAPHVLLILHNIRSAHNVGSMFRTADAAGVAHVYLSGYTPLPIDRFGRVQPDIAKTALGGERSVPWERAPDITSLIRSLQETGYRIVALEQDKSAVDYKTLTLETKTAVVLGNEVTGIDNDVLALCDTVAEIPMRGQKESLNVSVAAGVFLFRLLDR